MNSFENTWKVKPVAYWDFELGIILITYLVKVLNKGNVFQKVFSSFLCGERREWEKKL